MRELSLLFGTGSLELGTHYHCTPTSHTRDTVRRVDLLLPFLRAEHTCCLTNAILDFAKGAFFEVNRGKNHTLYLYLPELLICVKGITEVVFYFVFSFTVKEGSKKEQRPLWIDDFFTSRAFYLIFCLLVLPLHIYMFCLCKTRAYQ